MERSFVVWKIFFIFTASLLNESLGQTLKGLIPDCVFGAQNVAYQLYNRENRDGVIVDMNSTVIPVRNNKTTIFLVHGFTSEANITKYVNLTNILIDKYDVNVFSVDWKDGSCGTGGIPLTQTISYPSAVNNARVVGEDISKFISLLINDYGIHFEDIILIGHSLGAHVVGFAAKDLQKRGVGTVHNIMVLDPAGPGFETNKCDQRICATDAKFLQAIHTSYTLGMHRPIGSVDFYFNGGRNQDQCPILTRIPCSHSSAIQYLIDIIRDPLQCKFIGRQWKRSNFFPPKGDCTDETCSIPGPLASQLPARGTFYVNTKEVSSSCNISL